MRPATRSFAALAAVLVLAGCTTSSPPGTGYYSTTTTLPPTAQSNETAATSSPQPPEEPPVAEPRLEDELRPQAPAVAAVEKPSRAEAVKAIIAASRSSYSGSCPCPYDRDRVGRRCGGRSAYSRPGGADPKCYAADVTDADIAAYISGN